MCEYKRIILFLIWSALSSLSVILFACQQGQHQQQAQQIGPQEKQQLKRWAKLPIEIYLGLQLGLNLAEADLLRAIQYWEVKAGRKLFDYRGKWVHEVFESDLLNKQEAVPVTGIFAVSDLRGKAHSYGITTVISEKGFIVKAIVTIDSSTNYCFGTCVEDKRASFLRVATHELGHVIGLSDTSNVEDIMYGSIKSGGDIESDFMDRDLLLQLLP